MADPYLGQIIAVGFKLIPVGWRLCDGSLLSISEYEALFALIGTTYGGDGIKTFALPDLQGRLVVGQGQGRGLSSYALGQNGGAEQVQLRPQEVGAHSHAMNAAKRPSTAPPDPPQGPAPMTYLTTNTQTSLNVYSKDPPDVALSPSSVTPSSLSWDAHENRQPYLPMNYIIATSGIFPSQS